MSEERHSFTPYMLKQHFHLQYQYNKWAWTAVYDSVAQLVSANEDAYWADHGFFWGSIHRLLIHGLDAESVWLQRSNGVSPSLRADEEYADFAAVRAEWEQTTDGMIAFVDSLSDDNLARIISYTDSRGGSYSASQSVILQHVITHGMEHRSQITPILYQLGYPTRPLDLIYAYYDSGEQWLTMNN